MAQKTGTTNLPVEQVMVTAGPTSPVEGTIIKTPAGQADLQVVAVSKWNQVWIRTARSFGQVLMGNLTSVGAGVILVVEVFGYKLPLSGPLATILIALSLTILPTLNAFLQNAVELLNDLDKKWARFRA